MEKGKLKFNWPLVGNRHITDYLERAISGDNLSGCYIFQGPDNLGKTTLAKHFAQILLCENLQAGDNMPCGSCASCFRFRETEQKNSTEFNFDDIVHGDYHILKKDKEKKNISVEQVRVLIKSLSMSSFLGSYKIGIIKKAETLSQEAANALLKTLEEPREKVVIILIVEDLDKLPATIVSRCQVLYFYPVSSELIYDYLINTHKANRSEAKNFSNLALGRPAVAVKYLKDNNFFGLYKDKVNIFINFIGQDIVERFNAVEKIIGYKAAGQESVLIAKKIITAWQGVIRDWILIEFGQSHLIQNKIFENEIRRLNKRYTVGNLVNILNITREAMGYLDNNVNPKSVLEFIALSV